MLGVADTDHRVDLYALGCVGYWLLTGKLIFEGRCVVEVMFHHARTPPPRPSTTFEMAIPAPLEDLLMECLEKDPARPSDQCCGGEHPARRRFAGVGLDGRASGALVGDAPAATGGRAPGGGGATVPGGAGGADRAAGKGKGVATQPHLRPVCWEVHRPVTS